jgi:two-component system sensor histidine kinase DesK
MTLGDNAGWGFLFTYCAAMAALMLPRLGLAAVAATALLAAVSSALGGASSGTTLGYVVSAAGIGLLMLGMRDLRERNRELFRARAELARLAVAEERQRFARDLHDLLGHSLSVIALKAELAGRLLPARPDDAAREIAQLEQVARSALGEVREAVSGYRELTLDGELAGARMALSAAGIETSVEVGSLELPGEAEAVLAWAVREGATNVIRHSGARRCVFRVGRGEWGGAELEMVDDGVGTDAPVAAGEGGVGHGLRGLAERVGALQGTLEAGSGVGGGFRLAVRIPVSPGGSRL